jgi:hypothetical protein
VRFVEEKVYNRENVIDSSNIFIGVSGSKTGGLHMHMYGTDRGLSTTGDCYFSENTSFTAVFCFLEKSR